MVVQSKLITRALRGRLTALRPSRAMGDSTKRGALAREELAVLARAFQRFDSDVSGKLCIEELKQALQDIDIPADEIYVDSLFKALDKNKDGSVELTEWLDNLPVGTRIRVVDKFGEGTGSALDEYRAVRLEVPTASVVYTTSMR